MDIFTDKRGYSATLSFFKISLWGTNNVLLFLFYLPFSQFISELHDINCLLLAAYINCEKMPNQMYRVHKLQFKHAELVIS